MKDILINLLSGLEKHPSLVIDLITLCEENKEIKPTILNNTFISALPALLLSEYLKETIELLVLLTETAFNDYFYDKKFLFFVVDKIYECVLLLKDSYEEEEKTISEKSSLESENASLKSKSFTEKEINLLEGRDNSIGNNEDFLEENKSSSDKTDITEKELTIKPKKLNHNYFINLLKLVRNLLKNDQRRIIYELFYNLGLFLLLTNISYPLIEEIYNLVFENVLEIEENTLLQNNQSEKDEGIIEYERKHFGTKIVLRKRPLVNRTRVNLNYRKGNEIYKKLINNETLLYKNVLCYSLTLKETNFIFFTEKYINNLMEDEKNLRLILLFFNKIYKERMLSLFVQLNLNLLSKFKERTFEFIDLIYLIAKLTKELKSENVLNTLLTTEDISLLFDFLKYDVVSVLGDKFSDRVLFLINECLDVFDRKYFCKISHLIILSTVKSEISQKILRIIVEYLKEDALNFGRILFTPKELKKKKDKNDSKTKKIRKLRKDDKLINDDTNIEKNLETENIPEEDYQNDSYKFDLQDDCEEEMPDCEEKIPEYEEENFDIFKTNN